MKNFFSYFELFFSNFSKILQELSKFKVENVFIIATIGFSFGITICLIPVFYSTCWSRWSRIKNSETDLILAEAMINSEDSSGSFPPGKCPIEV